MTDFVLRRGRRWLPALAFFVLAAGLAGCSAIPAGGDPATDGRVVALAAAGRPKLGRLAVAPIVSFSLAVDEAAKGWRPEEAQALAPELVRHDLARGLAASGAWDGVRLASANALNEAWEQRDDWVLSLELHEVRTHFDGRNGWWIPNIVNFLINTPFSWWVATEEYSLTLEATLTLSSGDTGALVGRTVVPVRVRGTFDEFDRGWQILGPIVSSLDAEGWRGIATRLFAEARLELSVRSAMEIEALLRGARETQAFTEAQRKTLVLAVGVTSYEDPRALPAVAFAREDAGSVATTFERLGAHSQQIVTLTDGMATVAAVTSTIAQHLGRAREGDSVVLWFSGYGTRLADGRAAVVLYDSAPGTGLALEDLDRALAALPGDKLLILDATFGGGARSIAAAATTAGFKDSESTAVAMLFAGRNGDGALAPEHLRSGLLTFHTLRVLERQGQQGRWRVTLRELFAQVQAAVSEEAECLGSEEVPVLVESSRRFAFALGKHQP